MLFCKYLQKDRNDKLESKIAATPEISSVDMICIFDYYVNLSISDVEQRADVAMVCLKSAPSTATIFIKTK